MTNMLKVDTSARQRVFEIRVFPLPGELPKAIAPHLPACQLYCWQLGPNMWSSPMTKSCDYIVVTTRVFSVRGSLPPWGAAGERSEFNIKPPLGAPLLIFGISATSSGQGCKSHSTKTFQSIRPLSATVVEKC